MQLLIAGDTYSLNSKCSKKQCVCYKKLIISKFKTMKLIHFKIFTLGFDLQLFFASFFLSLSKGSGRRGLVDSCALWNRLFENYFFDVKKGINFTFLQSRLVSPSLVDSFLGHKHKLRFCLVRNCGLILIFAWRSI